MCCKRALELIGSYRTANYKLPWRFQNVAFHIYNSYLNQNTSVSNTHLWSMPFGSQVPLIYDWNSLICLSICLARQTYKQFSRHIFGNRPYTYCEARVHSDCISLSILPLVKSVSGTLSMHPSPDTNHDVRRA